LAKKQWEFAEWKKQKAEKERGQTTLNIDSTAGTAIKLSPLLLQYDYFFLLALG